MTELELRIAYTGKYWLEAMSDVECYLPPDDSDSWGDNTGELLEREKLAEQEFLQLLEEYRK